MKRESHLLSVVDIYKKYAWIVLLDFIIISPFQKVLDESSLKPNKIWVDQGSDF